MRSECAASESEVSTSSAITADHSTSSKRPKEIESTQESVKNMCSLCVLSISLNIKPEAPPYHNNLQSSYNNDPKYKYIIPLVSIDIIIYTKTIWGPKPFQELDKFARNKNPSFHNVFMVTGRVFFINCYNTL